MTIFLTILHVIVCLMLILVILLQAGRGQGLTGPSFSSGNVQSLFGTRAADFLTKATSVAAICFLFTCIGLNYLEVRKSRSLLQGPSKNAPLDMEQIKKALEKVKSESADAAKSSLPPGTAAKATGAETAKPATAAAAALPDTNKPAALPDKK